MPVGLQGNSRRRLPAICARVLPLRGDFMTISRWRRLLSPVLLGLALSACTAPTAAPPAPPDNEARTAAYLQQIRDRPPYLDAFLRRMPKGGDLHNHNSGAIYAES